MFYAKPDRMLSCSQRNHGVIFDNDPGISHIGYERRKFAGILSSSEINPEQHFARMADEANRAVIAAILKVAFLG